MVYAVCMLAASLIDEFVRFLRLGKDVLSQSSLHLLNQSYLMNVNSVLCQACPVACSL